MSSVRLWLPTLETVRDSIWPPYCVCCGAPADRFTEWSGTFDVSGGGHTGHEDVELSLPFCTTCLKHDSYASDIPGLFLWEEMGLAGWAGFPLLWGYVGLDTGTRALVLLSALSFLGSLTWLALKAIKHNEVANNAKAALACWIRPACVPLQSHPVEFLSEVANLQGSGTRTYVLSFANTEYAMRFATTNALSLLV